MLMFHYTIPEGVAVVVGGVALVVEDVAVVANEEMKPTAER